MRQVADLVTSDENGHFARTIVNRLWAKFFGRGLVEPLEHILDEPWHADLLEWLAADFVAHGYDLRHTMSRMIASRAYQLPAVAEDPDAETFAFRGPLVRRRSAEQFLDALGEVTGAWRANPKFNPPHVPGGRAGAGVARIGHAAHQGAWPHQPGAGRVGREAEGTTLQAIELTNGDTLAKYMRRAAETMLAGDTPPEPGALTNRIYLSALLREPTPEEAEAATAVLGAPVTQAGLEDLLWAIAMQPEFQLIHEDETHAPT